MSQSISIEEVQKQLQSSPSPHIRRKRRSRDIMTDVMIALVPPIIAAAYFFGWWVFVQIAVGVGVSALAEYGYQKLSDKKITLYDRSVFVTGLLVSLSFPVSSPLWVVAAAALIAVLIVKHWNFGFGPGGLGRNYLNPALTARVVAKILFQPAFANWILPNGFFSGPYGGFGVDAVATATPLEYLNRGATEISSQIPDLWDLFLGVDVGGNIGETSKLAILIGMIYLIVRRVINPKVPLLFILGGFLVATFWGNFDPFFSLTHVLSGTFLFVATYMVTDYSSGCLTPEGKSIFAFCAGALTVILRIAVGFPGAVGISVIIMNICAPFIDRAFMPKIYGHNQRPNVVFDRQKDSLDK